MANPILLLIMGAITYCFFIYLLYRTTKKNQQPKDKQSKPYKIPRNFFTILRDNRKRRREKEENREGKDNRTYRQSGDTRTQEEIQDELDEKFNKPDRWKKDYM